MSRESRIIDQEQDRKFFTMADNSNKGKVEFPGFYLPCSEHLIKIYDLTTAAIYGQIWLFNRSGKVCSMSQETIAEILGIVRATVNRKIQRLLDDGYILDATPDGRTGMSCNYWVTNKLEAEVQNEPVPLSYTPPVTKNDTPCNLELHKYINRQEEKETEGASQRTSPGSLGKAPSERNVAASRSTITQKHPAIKAIKQVSGFYPPKSLYDRIIEVVGEVPDISRLQETFDTWIANGYRPTNYKGWLLDWYREGMHYLAPSQRLDPEEGDI